jgi:hypothetical protein
MKLFPALSVMAEPSRNRNRTGILQDRTNIPKRQYAVRDFGILHYLSNMSGLLLT